MGRFGGQAWKNLGSDMKRFGVKLGYSAGRRREASIAVGRGKRCPPHVSVVFLQGSRKLRVTPQGALGRVSGSEGPQGTSLCQEEGLSMPSTHLGAAGPKGRATVGLWVQAPPGGGSEDTHHVIESLSRSLLGKKRWYQRCLEDAQRGQACRPGSHSLSQEQTGANNKQNSAMSECTSTPAPRCTVQSMASQLTPGLRLELGAWADSGGGICHGANPGR